MFYILPLHLPNTLLPILTLYRASAVPPRVPLPLYVRTQHYLIIAGKSYHHSAGPALPLSWSPDQSSSLGHNHHLSPEARRYSGQALTATNTSPRSQSPHGARAKQGRMCRSHRSDPGASRALAWLDLNCRRRTAGKGQPRIPLARPRQPYLLGAAGGGSRLIRV